MMKKKITCGKKDMNDYCNLLYSLYGNHHAYDYFISDIMKAVDYSFSSPFQKTTFVELSGNTGLLTHAAIIEDSRLLKGSAFFGFFECVDDKNVFFECWDELKRLATGAGIEMLLGPVNGSIWHSYRICCKNSSEQFFPSEPISQPYYFNYFQALNPKRVIEYHSAFRRRFDLILKVTEPSSLHASGMGISIQLSQIEPLLLKQIYDLSLKIFSENWGYTELSYEEFLLLYNTDKIKDYIGSVYTVMKGSELLGFCSTIEYDTTLVMKTIGILPEWQGQGIGNALVHAVHKDAINNKVDKIIYGLVKKDNKVKYFPMDDIEVFREYTVFEFVVK